MLLRIGIDRKWQPYEFSQFFLEIEFAYYVAALYQDYDDSSYSDIRELAKSSIGAIIDHNPNRVLSEGGYFRDFLREDSAIDGRIFVNSIKFSSPGFIDFSGIAAVISETRKFVGSLLNSEVRRTLLDKDLERTSIENNKERMELMAQAESLKKSKLENAMLMLKILDTNTEVEAEQDPLKVDILRHLVNENRKIESLIYDGKVTRVELIDD